MSNRGIIVTPPFDFGPGIIQPKDFTDFDIRQYLLYWDKIDFPNNDILSINPKEETQEILYLKEVGILTQSLVRFGSYSFNEFSNPVLDMQMEVFKYRNKEEPGCWSIAQSGRSLQLPEQSSEKSRTIQVELYNALPIPPNTVSLEDILNFKEKRKDELTEFRLTMDKFYERIINSNDIPHTKNSVIEELEMRIIDLNKVCHESWSQNIWSTLKAIINPKFNLNINDFQGGLTLGTTLSLTNPVTFEIALPIGIISGLFSCISFEPIVTLQPQNLPKELRAYAYLNSINKELK